MKVRKAWKYEHEETSERKQMWGKYEKMKGGKHEKINTRKPVRKKGEETMKMNISVREKWMRGNHEKMNMRNPVREKWRQEKHEIWTWGKHEKWTWGIQ